MKTFFLGGLILLLTTSTWGQNPEYAFRISFNNKANSPYNLQNPEQFLSQRALHRRAKWGIPVDSSDLPVSEIYIDSVLNQTNGDLKVVSKWFNDIVITVLDSNLVSQLNLLSFVTKTELVAVYPNGHPRPQPPNPLQAQDYDAQYYGSGWPQVHQLNGEVLHENGFQGRGVLITLIDAGFWGADVIDAFDSIRNGNQILDQWNFSTHSVRDAQEGDHGTRVLSILAANLPQTYVGTAPKASFLLYNTEDLESEQPVEEDNWVAAAEKADSLGTDLITTSLGYNTFDAPFPDLTHADLDGHTTLISRAVNKAAQKGILVVSGAGNEGANSWHGLLTPGDADSALTVGAVDPGGNPATFSSFGPNASGRVKPDVVALGSGIFTVNSFGSILSGNGTSFSTPVITGLTACLMEADSSLAPWDIKNLIRSSANLYPAHTDQMGYGIPNFAEASGLSTGINTPQLTRELSFFPNPVEDGRLFLNLGSGYSGQIEYRVISISGTRILKSGVLDYKGNPIEIFTGSLTPGIYYLSISGLGNFVCGTLFLVK